MMYEFAMECQLNNKHHESLKLAVVAVAAFSDHVILLDFEAVAMDDEQLKLFCHYVSN
jgi:hypothetical protein